MDHQLPEKNNLKKQSALAFCNHVVKNNAVITKEALEDALVSDRQLNYVH